MLVNTLVDPVFRRWLAGDPLDAGRPLSITGDLVVSGTLGAGAITGTELTINPSVDTSLQVVETTHWGSKWITLRPTSEDGTFLFQEGGIFLLGTESYLPQVYFTDYTDENINSWIKQDDSGNLNYVADSGLHDFGDEALSTAKAIINQDEDAAGSAGFTGLTIKGFDDENDEHFKVQIDSIGRTHIYSTKEIHFRPYNTLVGKWTTGAFVMEGDINFQFGDSSTDRSELIYSKSQTNNALIIGVNSHASGTHGRTVIIADEEDTGFDFEHTVQSNPTLFIHSENQATDEWISFTHDQTDGVIAVGTGVIKLGGDTIISGTLNAKKVIEEHSGDDTLLAAESGSVHTNLGATGVVTLILPPSAAEGIVFMFAVQAAQDFRIDPGLATIRDDSGQTADKYKVANAVGECITLVADSNGDWVTISKHGTWTEE